MNAIRLFSNDMRIEVGISNCAILVMKRGKLVLSDGLELPKTDVIKNIDTDRVKRIWGYRNEKSGHSRAQQKIKGYSKIISTVEIQYPPSTPKQSIIVDILLAYLTGR